MPCRYEVRCVVVDDCLYVIGGVDTSSDRKPVNTVEMYIPSGHKNADQYLNSTSAPNNSLRNTAIIVIVVFIIVILVFGVVGVVVLRVRKRRI
jgi:t-SNARE complex subunit (syntaxin)